MRLVQVESPTGKKIYTLAQRRTPSFKDLPNAPVIILTGKGADLSNRAQLKRWAKRKTISIRMVLALIDVAKKYNDTDFITQCWNTFHCLSTVHTYKGRLYTNYCKNRQCTLCCSIRKAELINKYAPYIRANWKQAYFLTLTVKSPDKNKLREHIDEMYSVLNSTIDKYRRGSKKGKCIKLQGIKAFECLFNPDRQTYHTHFHIIVPNKAIGEILLQEWLSYWGPKMANAFAQKLKPVWNMKGALIEVIKYGSKIFTEPDRDRKLKGSISPKIYAAGHYHILKAMQGRRIFDRFGFNLPKESTTKQPRFTEVVDYKVWNFDPQTCDYINELLDEPLIGYTCPDDLKHLLRENIDVLLE